MYWLCIVALAMLPSANFDGLLDCCGAFVFTAFYYLNWSKRNNVGAHAMNTFFSPIHINSSQILYTKFCLWAFCIERSGNSRFKSQRRETIYFHWNCVALTIQLWKKKCRRLVQFSKVNFFLQTVINFSKTSFVIRRFSVSICNLKCKRIFEGKSLFRCRRHRKSWKKTELIRYSKIAPIIIRLKLQSITWSELLRSCSCVRMHHFQEI